MPMGSPLPPPSLPAKAQKPSPRLFVAVEPPRAVKDHLQNLQAPLPGARWTKWDNLHITLRFLGETPEPGLALIRRALLAVDTPPFTLTVNGLGFFTRKRQTVLWAGLEPSSQLAALSERIHFVLERDAGIASPAGTLTPHITLARLKQADGGALTRFIREREQKTPAKFTVTSFTLFRSELLPQGPRYHREAVFALTLRA